jgi:hypothetical protein
MIENGCLTLMKNIKDNVMKVHTDMLDMPGNVFIKRYDICISIS